MSCAVIVPSKTISNLIACVEAIHDHDPGNRLVIVDDGLDLKPWPFILDGPEIIKGEKPFIFSRNINAGVRRAIELDPGVEGFILANDDCLLESPGGFTLLYEASKAHPELGIIGAVTDLTGQPLQQPRGIGLRVVPHIAFICCYIPRTTFENVQWMDCRYSLDYGCDDLDMCQAVTRAGLKIAVLDHCFVNHSLLVSTFRGDPKQPRSFQQNYGLYKEKWGVMA